MLSQERPHPACLVGVPDVRTRHVRTTLPREPIHPSHKAMGVWSVC